MAEPTCLFYPHDLSQVLRTHEQKALQAIDAMETNSLLNTSVEDLFAYFIEEYKVEPIRIFDDQIYVDQSDTKVDVSQDHSRLIIDRSGPFFIGGTMVTFLIPYQGDRQLFQCRPSTYNSNPPRAIITDKEIQMPFTRTDHNADAVKADFNSAYSSLKDHIGWIESDVNQFNQVLGTKIREHIERRREKILKDQGLVASLGFPLKKRNDTSSTYTAPVARKNIASLPAASTAPFTPEPTLAMEEYEHILTIVTNMVLVMERSPSAFQTMKEEDLRQHFLVQLNGQYEGQATGETFNNQGKTDILIRVNGKNIFIAECKFWKGEKAVSEAIDQLLGYTSWRDTKTALLVFNRSKNFSDVLGKLPEVIKAHPNFKRQVPYSAETGSRYVLHQIDDLNRELILTVLAFDIPANE